jgi:hypothetical protein
MGDTTSALDHHDERQSRWAKPPPSPETTDIDRDGEDRAGLHLRKAFGPCTRPSDWAGDWMLTGDRLQSRLRRLRRWHPELERERGKPV